MQLRCSGRHQDAVGRCGGAQQDGRLGGCGGVGDGDGVGLGRIQHRVAKPQHLVDAAGSHGLGDGFMLSYPDPGEAVAACVRIIEQMREGGAPGVHAGVHHGVVLYREGDYFGRAVNLAARLLGLAGRDELFASEAVVRATAGRFDWESRGTQGIRGFGEPVCVYSLRSASPT